MDINQYTSQRRQRKSEQKLRQILSRLKRDSDLAHSDMLFSEWLAKWLEIKNYK